MPRVKVVSKERTKQPITHLAVGGFKSIRDRSELELRPLTLFCGRNSSGKSSFMQPFLLMKQTLEAPIDPGPLLLHGPNVKFTEMEQLLWSGPRKRSDHAEFCVGFRGSHDADDVLEMADTPPWEQSLTMVFRADEKRHGIMADRMEVIGIGSAKKRHVLREGRPKNFRTLPIEHPDIGGVNDASVACVRGLLRIRLEYEHLSPLYLIPPYPFGQHVPTALREMLHLPGLRGNPERAYISMPIRSEFEGPFHPYTASVIAHWQDKSDLRIRRLGEWLARLELSSAAVAQRLDATRVELRVSRLPGLAKTTAKDLVNIADVGIGVSQVLPLLVALLVAEAGQIVYVEQPEIHLHPSAEVALSEILLDAARRGVIVVAETHSQRLLRGIQTAVAADSTLAPLVKLHWFSRGKDGATRVDSADLDEHGAFGDWPEDLADVELAIEEQYLRAALAQGAE